MFYGPSCIRSSDDDYTDKRRGERWNGRIIMVSAGTATARAQTAATVRVMSPTMLCSGEMHDPLLDDCFSVPHSEVKRYRARRCRRAPEQAATRRQFLFERENLHQSRLKLQNSAKRLVLGYVNSSLLRPWDHATYDNSFGRAR